MNSKIKIDSLKITFPKQHVQILDDNLGAEYKILYHETGELKQVTDPLTGEVDDFVSLAKHVVDETHGIKSRIALGSWTMGDQLQEVVFVQINAKMLRDKYFEGITINNWERVYDHIMNQRIIYVDHRQWMNAMVSDIDFCMDFEASPAELIETNKRMLSLVLPHMHKYIDTPFARETNVGLQFNKREKATPAKPFAKTYHKGLELKYNSHAFSKKFLQGQNFDNVARLEVNLKNSKHKSHFKLTDKLKSFKDLMELEEEYKEEIVKSAIPRYLQPLISLKVSDELPPVDRYTLWLFNQLMRHGYGKSAFYAGLDIFEDKQQRHRMRKKLIKLFAEIADQNQLNSNTRIDDIFKQLGIFE